MSNPAVPDADAAGDPTGLGIHRPMTTPVVPVEPADPAGPVPPSAAARSPVAYVRPVVPADLEGSLRPAPPVA